MNIMLACNAGMSTSLIVARMEEAAEEQGKNYKIWAVDQASIKRELGNFNILLLGPQVGYLQKKVTKLVEEKVPVAVIKTLDYGKCDGAAVLKFAEDTYNKFHV